MRPTRHHHRLRPGRHVWNRDGTLLAFIDGGSGNADLYLFDVRTEERLRQTSDGVTKWSPAIDPAGRRVAYLTGKVETFAVLSPRQLTLNPKTLRILDANLCVLDVVDGALKTYPIPGDPAYPGNLAWTPDGARVLYEIHGGNAPGTYAQTVPAPAALPAGKAATPRSIVVTPESEAAAALRSGDVRRVETVCQKREVSLEGDVLAAVREVLPKWAVAEDDRAAYALLRWIQETGVREPLPEIRGALKSPRWTIARTAVRTLVLFGAKETLPELDAVRTGRTEPELKVAAAAASGPSATPAAGPTSRPWRNTRRPTHAPPSASNSKSSATRARWNCSWASSRTTASSTPPPAATTSSATARPRPS
jgi:hypothetical protein